MYRVTCGGQERVYNSDRDCTLTSPFQAENVATGEHPAY